MQSSKQGMWKGVPFVNRSSTKGEPFSWKMVYKVVRGWTSGRNHPVQTFVAYPPPPLAELVMGLCHEDIAILGQLCT